jgi:glyoxylase-like metal-dependent hydrolase (beta-lactamase superfamily II)
MITRAQVSVYRHTGSVLAMLIAIAIFLPAPAYVFADASATNQRTVTKLAEGIYEIRHKDAPDHFSQGNTVVIIGDKAVMVVDSCYLPSSAREDIAQIAQWTNKPVRYLLNTHWHNDHIQGNAVYAESFPGIAIIAQTETAKLMALRIGSYLSEYPQRMEKFQRELDTGKDPGGRPLTEEEKEDLRNAIAGGKAASEAVSAEFRNLRVRLPEVTFDHELDIDLGNREVQLKYLGRGNTVGDAIAYLPKEKLLIAGDLVDSPVPYLYGGYPLEEIDTLKRMAALDFDTLVPGHGEVLKGKSFLQQETAMIEAVVEAMNREMGRTSDAPQTRYEEIKKAVEQIVDRDAWRQKFVGNNPSDREFFEVFAWPGLIEAAHAEMWPR